MRVGIVGTGAIARLHARAYRNIGFSVRAVVDVNPAAANAFVAEHGGEVVADAEALCRHPEVDYVDVCTLPNVRLQIVELCAKHRKHVQVQKPIATTVDNARRMNDAADRAGIVFGVVSQHRFDESSQFLEAAIKAGRLGRLLQCDAYVKWHRSDEYYSRPGKGTWDIEGGGALINQAIHQVDLLRWLIGPVQDVWGTWQLGAAHTIESEDNLSAVLRYANGAAGVIQASTAFWPGYPERIEIHGTKGTAIVTGDKLTTWDVHDDYGSTPPISQQAASGASDPMAISLEPFERQFRDFADAIRTGRAPAVSGRDGLLALEVVDAIYRACRTGERQSLTGA
ncbi:MAG: Gfo/Idh/MocA family oxidoreductase [Acidobacteria bacterium]|nr:Gfo/Idh/MocA family oxidoreductase [Acidobacteriota bacterium]